ncbi:MAG: hypothetical protein A2W19_04305 [Spirochaetes bacterium RBG_16_49_21]|nr:MAG: hypothetical protein A2W19_04305 [Spirochaetes bacterium RBG_16_49_21]
MKYQHTITADAIGDVPVIYIEGDLTSDADQDAKRVYSEVKNRYPLRKIIINFENTRYINSSGVATLIQIIQDVQERGGAVAFVGLSGHLHNVMDIVGVSNLVSIYDTNADVLKAV